MQNLALSTQISTHNLENVLSACDTDHEQKQKNKSGMKFDPIHNCFSWSNTRKVNIACVHGVVLCRSRDRWKHDKFKMQNFVWMFYHYIKSYLSYISSSDDRNHVYEAPIIISINQIPFLHVGLINLMVILKTVNFPNELNLNSKLIGQVQVQTSWTRTAIVVNNKLSFIVYI